MDISGASVSVRAGVFAPRCNTAANKLRFYRKGGATGDSDETFGQGYPCHKYSPTGNLKQRCGRDYVERGSGGGVILSG